MYCPIRRGFEGRGKSIGKHQEPGKSAIPIGLLDDDEPSIRYDAVISLADIEQKGPGWTTNIIAYQQEDGAIIPRWKEWWELKERPSTAAHSINQ